MKFTFNVFHFCEPLEPKVPRIHKPQKGKDTEMNKKRITLMLPEGLIELLNQELSVWETQTSKQIGLVLRDWVQKVIETRSQPPSNWGDQ